MTGGVQALSSAQRRQIAVITAVAVGLFVFVRLLPTGTNLSHMDFRVKGGNSIEFCDPANPQFLPVVTVRSPVELSIIPAATPAAGSEVSAVLTLKTYNGKPIGPEDLLVVQTMRIHLMLVDPSLGDYQHVHPEPGRFPGEWTFRFHPRFGGTYRAFADFTPVATARGLYSSTDLVVSGEPSATPAGTQPLSFAAEKQGYRFVLLPSVLPIRAGQPAELKLTVTKLDGGEVTLIPVMGSFAHLVAFDAARSGFAHIHPNETDLAHPLDASHPVLTFRVAIPKAGRYVIWCQVILGGKETFAPFWLEVAP